MNDRSMEPMRSEGADGRRSLAVLIVNWNSMAYVRKCLHSLFATSGPLVDEVVVVDGASYDGCGEMIADEFPDVTFVQCSKNVGFGRANNIGFRHVSAEMLLLLNPDTELTEGAVETMLREFERLPDCGLLGPRLLNTDGTLQTSCVMAFPTPLNQLLGAEAMHRVLPGLALWGNHHAFRAENPVAVDAVSGACMLMRSETFRKLGGFGSEYFMYGEDMDLCAKVAGLGMKVYHVPGAEVMHFGGGCSASQTSRFSAVLLRESNHRFIRTHQGRFAAFRYRAAMATSALVRLAVLGAAMMVTWGRRRKSAAAAFSKWTAVLRWALGLERWAREKSDAPDDPAACLAREPR